MAWALFLVQAKAAPPFYPPPPCQLQFRRDRLFLGSASRHLSQRRGDKARAGALTGDGRGLSEQRFRHQGRRGLRLVPHAPTGMTIESKRLPADPIGVSSDYRVEFEGDVARSGEVT